MKRYLGALFFLLITSPLAVQLTRGGFLNNKPLPAPECYTCPSCQNLGQIIELRFDPELKKYIWILACGQNHTWECFPYSPAR